MTQSNQPTSPSSRPGDGAPVTELCSTCPKYLTFQVKDANGALCVGMYYSVYLDGSGWAVKDGVLDANAKTRLFETTESGKQASLYIGHRLEAGLPEANTYDEAPLRQEVISSADRAYTAVVTTLRLWKPWSFSSAAAEESINEWERRRRYVYDDGVTRGDWNGTSNPVGTLTIGAGHALTRAEARGWYDRYPPSGLGMTDAEMDALFDSDVRNRARTADLNDDIHVPLYQREYDALVDLRFNAGSGASDFSGGLSNTGAHARLTSSSITSFLNAGRYTEAGNRILTTANSISGRWSRGVQNRRNFQRGMFFAEAWRRE